MTPFKYPYHALEIDQWFDWPISNPDGSYSWRRHNNLRTAVYRHAKRTGKKFEVRQFFDTKWKVRITRNA